MDHTNILKAIKSKVKELDKDSLSFHNAILINEIMESLVEIDMDLIAKNNSTSKTKILVIDDDPDVIKILKFSLEKDAIEVQSNKNPLDALTKLDIIKPDLIILDFMMPEMTGLEFLIEYKKIKLVHRCPIIISSAKNSELDKNICLKEGAIGYITKPFNIADIKERIKRIEKSV